jgi:hypothetical protein
MESVTLKEQISQHQKSETSSTFSIARMCNGGTYFISPIYIITICENRSKVALALASYIVMVVVVFCSSIEWNVLCWSEWEIKAAK